jgi:predicted HTH domain antitoxin
MRAKKAENITFDVPLDAMQAVSPTPDEFARAVRLAAAIFWYERAEISMGHAAQIAGLNVRDFLHAISRHEADIFVVDMDDLRREIALG